MWKFIVSDPQKKLNTPALITFLDAVQRVGLHPKTCRNWLDAGKFPLPTHKVNGMVMVPAVAVDVFIDAAIESSLTSLPDVVAEFFRGEIKARKQQSSLQSAAIKGKPGRTPNKSKV